jgi:hypothetical protein
MIINRDAFSLISEKTGDILEYGTAFEASKSLILDGVNYVKLSDGSGWVFEKKDGIEILELVEVVRIPVKTQTKRDGIEQSTASYASQYSPLSRPISVLSGHKSVSIPTVAATGASFNSSNSCATTAMHEFGTNKQVRSENRFWREIRGRCGNCTDFDAYLGLVGEVDSQQPSVSEGGGPARSGWMVAEVPRHEQQVRSCIGIIASITRQCR